MRLAGYGCCYRYDLRIAFARGGSPPRLPCLGTGRGCPTGVTRRGPCPDWAISHTNVLLVFE